MWPDSSQVFQLPVACVSFLHCSASPYSYNTPPINVWKKNTTLNSPFLLTTQYAQLINFYPPHNYPILVVHCSQLHIHCYLLATRTHNLLFIAYCSPLATFDLPITTHYSQRTKYNSPRIAKNSQFIIHAAHNSQLTAHNVQLTTCNSLLTNFLITKSLVIDYSLPSSRNSHFTIQNLLPITHFHCLIYIDYN